MRISAGLERFTITLHRIRKLRSRRRIRVGEAVDDAADGGTEGVDGAFCGFAEHGLELAKGVLEGTEVGAVGREEAQRGAGVLDQGADARTLVAGEAAEVARCFEMKVPKWSIAPLRLPENLALYNHPLAQGRAPTSQENGSQSRRGATAGPWRAPHASATRPLPRPRRSAKTDAALKVKVTRQAARRELVLRPREDHHLRRRLAPVGSV